MRVLLVDDDPAMLNVMERCCEVSGWLVDTARTFAEGRTLLQTKPDLLVADVRLEEFNGLYLAILARNVNPNVRVVIVSGFDDPVIRREAAAVGAEFLPKPFTPTDLKRAIQHACGPRLAG